MSVFDFSSYDHDVFSEYLFQHLKWFKTNMDEKPVKCSENNHNLTNSCWGRCDTIENSGAATKWTLRMWLSVICCFQGQEWPERQSQQICLSFFSQVLALMLERFTTSHLQTNKIISSLWETSITELFTTHHTDKLSSLC